MDWQWSVYLAEEINLTAYFLKINTSQQPAVSRMAPDIKPVSNVVVKHPYVNCQYLYCLVSIILITFLYSLITWQYSYRENSPKESIYKPDAQG